MAAFVFMSGKKINVVWISGAYYQARDILDKIKEKVKDTEHFFCDRTTPYGKLSEAIRSNFCFGSNRFILIHELPEMTDSENKKFKALLEDVSDDILIAFFMLEPTENKALYAIVEKIGRVYDSPASIPVYSARGWMESRCKELEISLEDSAQAALIENCGFDDKKKVSVDIMNMALQKLIFFAPGKKKYDLSDVIITASQYDNFIVWDLMNACNEKNFEKCLGLFEKCCMSKYGPKDALESILPIFLWKYRMLFFLKEGMSSRGPNGMDGLINDASSMRKITYIGQGLSAKPKIDPVQTGDNQGKPSTSWSIKPIRDAVFGDFDGKPALNYYNRKELYLIIRCLEDCTILTRSCQSDNEAMLIADTLFMTICSSVDQNVPRKLQEKLMSMRI